MLSYIRIDMSYDQHIYFLNAHLHSGEMKTQL